MSFQRPAVNDAPLSLVTLAGTPKKATQWLRKAEAAAEDVASVKGTACRNQVVLHIDVSKNLWP